jgi:hypothetical protein
LRGKQADRVGTDVSGSAGDEDRGRHS